MVPVRNSDVHCIKSTCFIVLRLLEDMNFCLIHQASPKCRHAISSEKVLEWVMRQYFVGFFLLGYIQTAQNQLWNTKSDLHPQTGMGDPTHPSPLRHAFKSWTSTLQSVSIFMLPHTTSSSWEKWQLRFQHYLSSYTGGDGTGERHRERERQSWPPPVAESRRRLHMVLSFKPCWSYPLVNNGSVSVLNASTGPSIMLVPRKWEKGEQSCHPEVKRSMMPVGLWSHLGNQSGSFSPIEVYLFP